MSEVTAEMIERGRGVDPKVTAQKRRIASKVRETREKLTSSGTGHRAFDIELLRIFARSRKGAAPAMVGLALVVALMAAIWVPLANILVWISLVATAGALNYGLAVKFLDLSEAEADVRLWRRKFVLAEVLQGSVWAMIVVLLLHVPDATARTFVLFVLLFVAAMSSLVSATVPYAVYAALLPITLAIVVFMQPYDDYEALPLTILAAAAQLYFIVLAKRLYSTSLASLSFRMEKEALIAELEQAKANSDEARRRAEEANLAKSRFLATMSHELRTPLNAILGFSEVMKAELFGAHTVPAYKEYSNDIHTSGRQLLMLINEILDLSRVEAGRYELKEESVSLAHVVEDCRHLLSLRAKKRDITVNEAIEAGLPRIWADERAVRQVTLNLLTNAIKFTPQGGVDHGQGRLDGDRRAISVDPRHRSRHSRRRDSDRHVVVRARLARPEERRGGLRPRPADRQRADRTAWRHLHPQVEGARRHRSHRRLPARTGDGRAAAISGRDRAGAPGPGEARKEPALGSVIGPVANSTGMAANPLPEGEGRSAGPGLRFCKASSRFMCVKARNRNPPAAFGGTLSRRERVAIPSEPIAERIRDLYAPEIYATPLPVDLHPGEVDAAAFHDFDDPDARRRRRGAGQAPGHGGPAGPQRASTRARRGARRRPAPASCRRCRPRR